ncbi:MAG: TMEM254 family protein [Microthrixaceae bacterium]
MSDDTTVSPRPNLLWRLGVVVGLGTLTTLSVSDGAWEQWEDNVGDAVPRSAMRNLLVGTVAVHAVEALAAHRSASAAGLDRPGRWARLTFLFGFPVLLRLRKARRLELAPAA